MSGEETQNKPENSNSDKPEHENLSEGSGLVIKCESSTFSEELKSLKKNNKFRDGILTLVGTLILSIGTTSTMAITNLSTYLVSYLSYFEPEGAKTLTFEHTYFIDPIATISSLIIIPFVGIIEKIN